MINSYCSTNFIVEIFYKRDVKYEICDRKRQNISRFIRYIKNSKKFKFPLYKQFVVN